MHVNQMDAQMGHFGILVVPTGIPNLGEAALQAVQ
jgi:hypothetical protein